MYSDTPHLYGNALSSVTVLRVGEKVEDGKGLAGEEKGDGDQAVEEGGDGEGVEWRKSRHVPETGDARKKFFLTKGKTDEWEWEEGRIYKADFFNPYLDFNGVFHMLFICFSSRWRRLLRQILSRIRSEAAGFQPVDIAVSGRRRLPEVC